jgi:lysozyme
MTDSQIREFRLAGSRPDGVNPFLSDAGAFLGDGMSLLERDAAGTWRPRPLAGLADRRASLATLAKALNRGDRSLAAIALVQAELPARLAKANPDVGSEPRDANGRWTLSAAGRKFVQSFEQGPGGGVALITYKDKAGYDTIGWGHKLTGNESFPNGISPDDAEQLFDRDLKRFKDAVNDSVKVPLTQSQFDALTSLAFNIGDDAFKRSTLLRLLNQGDYTNAGNAFMDWTRVKNDHPQGQINRRTAEQAMFSNGVYPQ